MAAHLTRGEVRRKQAIDTFFHARRRSALSGFVFVGTSVVQLTVAGFAMVNVVLTLVWLAIAAPSLPS